MKQRLQKSAKKQKKNIRSGISSTTMRLKQRLSSAKKKKRPAPERPVQDVQRLNTKRRRRSGRSNSSSVSSSNNSTSLHRENSSIRASKAIEKSLPEKRRKERQQRLKIMALGDMKVVEEHLKFGRNDQAKYTLDQMSPETITVAKTTSFYWIQKVQVWFACSLVFSILSVGFEKAVFLTLFFSFFLFFCRYTFKTKTQKD